METSTHGKQEHTMTSTESIYFVQYVDGTYAECKAEDADDALDQMCGSVEMAHGPVEGESPEPGNTDYHHGFRLWDRSGR
jgi:hypothetical protein